MSLKRRLAVLGAAAGLAPLLVVVLPAATAERARLHLVAAEPAGAVRARNRVVR